MEKKIKVTTYILRNYCDNCQKELSNGQILLTDPPNWKCICDCGATYIFDKNYPAIEYKEEE